MLSELPYYISIISFIAGLYIVIASKDLFHKTCGLVILQVGVLIFYIALGKIYNAMPPIKQPNLDVAVYSSPLPHVLMLTAIVVGFATLSVALAMLLKIYNNFGTLKEDELNLD